MSKHDKADERESTPVSRYWGDVAERWLGDWPRAELRRAFGETKELMKVEEFTDGDHLVVRAEMPGIDPDKDVHISVSDHTLRIQAERREETSTGDDVGYRSEFNYGSFARTLTLPVGASEDDVKATYKDGILQVRIPIDRRIEEAKKVPVQRV